jgi:glycosyltransferase involved in cell wall biosynthesis
MSKSQGKVSMVVPCYNKEKYIGAMLESVLTQEWDNIELLLVNDGSTDTTRDVIVSYLPKFEERGYEVKLIDQENGGCCKAVHTGLVNMSGDYFCLVDADDEIDTKYVSTMAGFLDGNRDFDWTACSYRVCIKDENGEFALQPATSCANMGDNLQLLERHIIRKEITTSWIYMVRKHYLDTTKLIENFCIERRKTYEPLFAVPLMLGGGKLKAIDEPLYTFNRYGSDMYFFDTFEKVTKYYEDYSYLYKYSIGRAIIPKKEKEKFYKLIEYGNRKDMLYHLNKMDKLAKPLENAENYLTSFSDEFVNFIDTIISPSPCIPVNYLMNQDYFRIIDQVDEILLNVGNGTQQLKAEKPRFVGYGVLGKIGLKMLSLLKDENFAFDCLWDKKANSEIIFDITIEKPDFNSLTENDIVVVFPKSYDVLVEVARAAYESKIIWNCGEVDLIHKLKNIKMFSRGTFVYSLTA